MCLQTRCFFFPQKFTPERITVIWTTKLVWGLSCVTQRKWPPLHYKNLIIIIIFPSHNSAGVSVLSQLSTDPIMWQKLCLLEFVLARWPPGGGTGEKRLAAQEQSERVPTQFWNGFNCLGTFLGHLFHPRFYLLNLLFKKTVFKTKWLVFASFYLLVGGWWLWVQLTVVHYLASHYFQVQ